MSNRTTSNRLSLAEEQLTSLVLVLVVIVAAIGAVYLAQASHTAATGRRVQELERQRELLEQQNAQLRAEVAALRSVPRLTEEARKMGYHEASPEEIVYVAIGAVPAHVVPTRAISAAIEGEAVPVYEETLESWLSERLAGFRESLRLLFRSEEQNAP